MHTLTVLGGHDKSGSPEGFDTLTLKSGELYAIVGNTGSGKSRLIKDIEQLADGDSITGRRVLLDNATVNRQQRQKLSLGLMAHLGQNMRFSLDTTVAEFLALHVRCREKSVTTDAVLTLANSITPEPITQEQHLNLLSGGQTRALMIADIALICDSPVVLIDEIENAGIDKAKALGYLRSREKLVLVVTHDPHTALMAPQRIIMQNGAVKAILQRTAEEEMLFATLSKEYDSQLKRQALLRAGGRLS